MDTQTHTHTHTRGDSVKLMGHLEKTILLHSQDLRCWIMVDQTIVTKLMLVCSIKAHSAIHIFVMIEVKTGPIHDDTQSWEEYPMVILWKVNCLSC